MAINGGCGTGDRAGVESDTRVTSSNPDSGKCYSKECTVIGNVCWKDENKENVNGNGQFLQERFKIYGIRLMWLDWGIFGKFFATNFVTKVAKICWNFRDYCERHYFYFKIAVASFCALSGKFGLLLITISGHTAYLSSLQPKWQHETLSDQY